MAGHVAPWNGKAGALQQQIGIHNACDLTRRFVEAGIEVVLADIVTAHTLEIYRDRVPEILVIRLRVSLTEARRRAALRTLYLTDKEFVDLHGWQAATDHLVDEVIDVDTMTHEAQIDAVQQIWRQTA